MAVIRRPYIIRRVKVGGIRPAYAGLVAKAEDGLVFRKTVPSLSWLRCIMATLQDCISDSWTFSHHARPCGAVHLMSQSPHEGNRYIQKLSVGFITPSSKPAATVNILDVSRFIRIADAEVPPYLVPCDLLAVGQHLLAAVMVKDLVFCDGFPLFSFCMHGRLPFCPGPSGLPGVSAYIPGIIKVEHTAGAHGQYSPLLGFMTMAAVT